MTATLLLVDAQQNMLRAPTPVPDAFAGTKLAELIPAGAPVVVAGMQSEYCIRATALAALHRGHPVTLVRGAHATYDDGQPAGELCGQVEQELAAAGVSLAALAEAPL